MRSVCKTLVVVMRGKATDSPKKPQRGRPQCGRPQWSKTPSREIHEKAAISQGRRGKQAALVRFWYEKKPMRQACLRAGRPHRQASYRATQERIIRCSRKINVVWINPEIQV